MLEIVERIVGISILIFGLLVCVACMFVLYFFFFVCFLIFLLVFFPLWGSVLVAICMVGCIWENDMGLWARVRLSDARVAVKCYVQSFIPVLFWICMCFVLNIKSRQLSANKNNNRRKTKQNTHNAGTWMDLLFTLSANAPVTILPLAGHLIFG